MGTIKQFFGTLLHPAPRAANPRRVNIERSTRACDLQREREQPVLFAEIVAASAFLDFGGVPDGRWFHALYAWRLSEACECVAHPAPENDGSTARPGVWPDSSKNKTIEGSFEGRRLHLLSAPFKA